MHPLQDSQAVLSHCLQSNTDAPNPVIGPSGGQLVQAVSQLGYLLVSQSQSAVARIPSHVSLFRLKPTADKIALSKDFLKAAAEGNLNRVQILIEQHSVPASYDGNRALCMAASEGHLEIIKYLVQKQGVNPAANHNFSLRWAALKGHTRVVLFLLNDPRVDPTTENNIALEWAVKNGHTDVLRLLLAHPKVNPLANQLKVMKVAIEEGQLNSVQVLMNDARINPATQNNTFLLQAIQSGHFDIVALFLLDGRYLGASNGEQVRQKLIELAETSDVFQAKLNRMYHIALDKLTILFQGLSLVGSTDMLQEIATQGGVTHGLFPLLTAQERQAKVRQLIHSLNKKSRSA